MTLFAVSCLPPRVWARLCADGNCTGAHQIATIEESRGAGCASGRPDTYVGVVSEVNVVTVRRLFAIRWALRVWPRLTCRVVVVRTDNLRSGGCNGMSYTLNYAHSKEKFDEVVDSDGA